MFVFNLFHREETLNVTLWGEVAENFDENTIQAMPEPVVIAFSAMAAKQYMGKYIYNNKKKNLFF